jgi:hypothetical protein
MSRPDLAAELDAVTRHLVLLAALVENLSYSVRRHQDGPEAEDDAPVAPAGTRPATGKGKRAAHRRPSAPGDLPPSPERSTDGTGLPVCTCPPCLAERERGERP